MHIRIHSESNASYLFLLELEWIQVKSASRGEQVYI